MPAVGSPFSTPTGTVTTQYTLHSHTHVPAIPTPHNYALPSSKDGHPQNSPIHIIIPHTPSSDMPNMEQPSTFVYKIKDSGPKLSSEFESSQAPRQKSGPAHQSDSSEQTHSDSPQRDADQSFNITAEIEFQVQYDKAQYDNVKVLNMTFQNHPKLKLENKDLEELKRHITQKFHQKVQQKSYADQVRPPQIIAVIVFAVFGGQWYIMRWLFLSVPKTPFDEVDLQKSGSPKIAKSPKTETQSRPKKETSTR